MSYDDYDEPEDDSADLEPTTPPVALPLPSEASVTVTVYAAQMQDQILRQIAAQVTKLFESMVAKTVHESVYSLVEQIGREQIGEAVRSTLAEGWARTDDYGSVKGRATLKDRIGELLNSRDRYGNNARWADKIVEEETKSALKGELAKEIDAAKVKLRSEVDAVLQAKLKEALRQSLGL